MPHCPLIVSHRAIAGMQQDQRDALMRDLRIAGVAAPVDAGAVVTGPSIIQLDADVAAPSPSRPTDDEWPQPLAARGVMAELSLCSTGQHDRPSSSRADPRAGRVIRAVSDRARAGGGRLALRPRAGCWMQRIEDAVRLAMRVNRPDVGVCFDLGAWRTTDGRELAMRLQLAGPRLWHVVIDDNADDLRPLTAALDRLGYAGTVGLDADTPEQLRKTVAAWRQAVSRS